MTTLHQSTFNYLKPTDAQMRDMQDARDAAYHYANALERLLPDGPDKTYVMRKLRELAMWCNVSITRQPDGSPRVHDIDSVVRESPADHPVEGDLGSVPL
jgi:hypothetical protein